MSVVSGLRSAEIVGSSVRLTADLRPLTSSSNPLSNRSGDESPPRRSDIGFIVKHRPKRLTQKPRVRQA